MYGVIFSSVLSAARLLLQNISVKKQIRSRKSDRIKWSEKEETSKIKESYLTKRSAKEQNIIGTKKAKTAAPENAAATNGLTKCD
jgi:hypothetical protein